MPTSSGSSARRTCRCCARRCARPSAGCRATRPMPSPPASSTRARTPTSPANSRQRAGRAGAGLARPARDGRDTQRSHAGGPDVSDLPPGLDDFGRRLEQAAAREIEERERERRRTAPALAQPRPAGRGGAARGGGERRCRQARRRGSGDPIAPESGDDSDAAAGAAGSCGDRQQRDRRPGGRAAVGRARLHEHRGHGLRAGRAPARRRLRPGPGRRSSGRCRHRRRERAPRPPRAGRSSPCGASPTQRTLVFGLAVDRTP